MKYANLVYEILRDAEKPMTPLEIGQQCGAGGEQARSVLRRSSWAKKVGMVPGARGNQVTLWEFDSAASQVVEPPKQRSGQCSNCPREGQRLVKGLCPRCYNYQRHHEGQMWTPDRIKDKNTVVISLRVPKTLYRRLRRIAQRDDTTVGGLARKLMEGAK